MINPHTKTYLIISMLTMLSACATTSSKWQNETDNEIVAELENARQTASINNKEINNSLSTALMPPLKIDFPLNIVPPPIERFNVAVNKSKAKDVYLNLVKGTKYSVIIDPGVNAKISLNLKNVTLDDVFSFIEHAYGFHYEKNDTHYIVYGNKLTTKIFHVDYINMKRGGNSSTTVSSGGLQEGGGKAGIEIQTNSQVDFWKNITDDLKAIVGEEEGHRITVNHQSGIIIARALPGELRMIADYLNKIQSSITRQVILETKLLEVDLSDGYQTGINWGQLFTRGSNSLNINQIGGGSALTGSNITGIGGNSTPSIVNSGINGGVASAFGGVFSMALQTSNFGAFIELISTQGKVQVLSSPRIAALNNQKAVIKVGGEEFYVTGVQTESSSSTDDTNANPVPTVTMQTFFSGIALDVTPQIGEDGDILLHLHPTVSDVSQKNKTFIVYGYNFDLPLAASSVRETDTVVRTKSGQIIVVGGLMKQETVDIEASIPLLGDLPLIGNLFKHKKASRTKKELVVLVKATLADSNSTWSNEAAATMMRFSELRD